MFLWLLKSLHHWLGAACAAFLILIALSGVALVALGAPEPVCAEDGSSLSENEQVTRAATLLNAIAAETNPAFVAFPTDKNGCYATDLSRLSPDDLEPGLAAWLAADEVAGLYGFVYRVHTGLTLSGPDARMFVVWCGIIAMLMVMLGLIIAAPGLKRFRLQIFPNPRRPLRGEMRRSHVSLGLTFGAFVVFYGATGWLIGAPAEAELRIAEIEKSSVQILDSPLTDAYADVSSASSLLMTRALMRPGAEGLESVVFYEGRGRKMLIANLRPEGRVTYEWGADGRYQERFADGDGIFVIRRNAARVLHGGEGAWPLYKFLLVLTALGACGLWLTGLISYVLRWRARVG